MCRAGENFCLLHPLHQCRQIRTDTERNPVNGTHGGADRLGIINVHTAPAHKDSICPRPFRCPEDRPQVPRILDILQNQKKGLLFLQHLFHRAAALAHNAEHSLGRLRIAHLAEDLIFHFLPGKFLQSSSVFRISGIALRCIDLHKALPVIM